MQVLTFTAMAEPEHGEAVVDRYFDRYWLPIIGPTATVTMRHLAGALAFSESYRVALPELAAQLGVAEAVLQRKLKRLVNLELLQRAGRDQFRVRVRVRPLEAGQVDRLPEPLASQHRDLSAILAAS